MSGNSQEHGIRYSIAVDTERGVLLFTGRDAWALQHLIRAGEDGVTPLERPAPRWSHYVWKLRGAGLDVETITEPHGGTYAGTHARYVLRTPCRIRPGARKDGEHGAAA